jgi:hypothetical protein
MTPLKIRRLQLCRPSSGDVDWLGAIFRRRRIRCNVIGYRSNVYEALKAADAADRRADPATKVEATFRDRRREMAVPCATRPLSARCCGGTRPSV